MIYSLRLVFKQELHQLIKLFLMFNRFTLCTTALLLANVQGDTRDYYYYDISLKDICEDSQESDLPFEASNLAKLQMDILFAFRDDWEPWLDAMNPGIDLSNLPGELCDDPKPNLDISTAGKAAKFVTAFYGSGSICS